MSDTPRRATNTAWDSEIWVFQEVTIAGIDYLIVSDHRDGLIPYFVHPHSVRYDDE